MRELAILSVFFGCALPDDEFLPPRRSISAEPDGGWTYEIRWP